MRFYTQQHRFYSGIDLHARLLAICIVDQAGNFVLRQQIADDKQLLLDVLAPFRPDFPQAARPPSQHLTGETADRRDQRRFTVRPGPTRRFDRPSGGTEEFLGRRVARPGSRRAQAKGALAEPLIWAWHCRRLSVVAAMTEARGAATREAGSRLVITVTTGLRETATLRVRALDY